MWKKDSKINFIVERLIEFTWKKVYWIYVTSEPVIKLVTELSSKFLKALSQIILKKETPSFDTLESDLNTVLSWFGLAPLKSWLPLHCSITSPPSLKQF